MTSAIRRASAMLALVLALVPPSNAQDPPKPIRLGSWVLTGSVRSRIETWNWFEPDRGDPRYTFMGNHARLGLTRSGKKLDGTIELAMPILLGLPDNAVGAGAQGQLGAGASYFVANHSSRNAASVFPKQLFVRIKGLGSTASSLRIGRFEFQDGSEVTAENPSMAAIKRDRVHQRLLGPFVFTHVMRSFDGLHYVYNKPKINYTVIGAVPTRGVFQVDGWGWTKTAFAYASATGQIHAGKPNTGEWRLFALYYQDWRRVLKADNRPAAVRSADTANIRIGTYGGHYVQLAQTNAGTFDFLALAAAQTGQWGLLDHRAGMVDLEAGFQPRVLPRLKPWFRAGYYYGSGDGNPADGKHGTFFQVLPTARPFARFPFFDMMNNEDRFGMLTVRPHRRVTMKAEVHSLRLANRNDLWYLGGGAFQPWTFGYQARPGGARSLANLYDVSADFTVNRHISYTLYYSHAAGKSVIGNLHPRGRNGDFAYAEMTYRF